MSPRPKPVTFSEFLLLIRSKYSTLPTTVLKQKPVLASVTAFSWFSSLPSNAHVLLDSIFDSCLIPSLNHRFEPPAQCWRFPNSYFQSSHLSWASDPVAICLLSIPTWMSQPSPSPKTCSSSYIPIFPLVLAYLLLHCTLPALHAPTPLFYRLGRAPFLIQTCLTTSDLRPFTPQVGREPPDALTGSYILGHLHLTHYIKGLPHALD